MLPDAIGSQRGRLPREQGSIPCGSAPTGVAQQVEAPGREPGGCGFDSRLRYSQSQAVEAHAAVAQPGRGAALRTQRLRVRIPPAVLPFRPKRPRLLEGRSRGVGLWGSATAWGSTPRQLRWPLRRGQLSRPRGQPQVLHNGAHPPGAVRYASTRRLPPHPVHAERHREGAHPPAPRQVWRPEGAGPRPVTDESAGAATRAAAGPRARRPARNRNWRSNPRRHRRAGRWRRAPRGKGRCCYRPCRWRGP